MCYNVSILREKTISREYSMSQKKNVRIKDIAERAGVSISTVSNVLTGKRQQNSEAGRRVLEVAAELGYITNSAAAKPAVHFVVYKKSGQVVMDTPFFSELFSGIEHACASRGYALTFSFIDSAHDPDYEDRLNALLSDPAAPLLVLATEMCKEDLAPFRGYRGPLVMLDSLFQTEQFNTISIDNYAAGWQGGEILMSHGHTRAGLITSSIVFNNMLYRNRGFKSALRSQGIALLDEDVFAVEPTMDGSYRDMLRLLERRKRPLPTGFFAVNDIMAAGAMRALAERGVRIPEDVSIVGMDNMPFGRITAPALTTLDVPKRQISELAVERLIRIAENPDNLCLKTVVQTTPVLRDSVKTL